MNKHRWVQQGWLNSPSPKKEAKKTEENSFSGSFQKTFSDAFCKVHFMHCSYEEAQKLPYHLWSKKLEKNDFKSEEEANVYRDSHGKFVNAYEEVKMITKEIKKKHTDKEKKKKANKKK